jgi:Zn-finger nucleic acid-binding protein
MKCPVDGATLVIADRNGVEIDYCPQCRGVWLDRGELDKIIERAAAYSPPPPPPPQAPQGRGYEERGYDRGYARDYHGKPRKKKKMSSFLDDIFDF